MNETALLSDPQKRVRYEMKQVIVMRTDLNMRKGKMIAQGAHASMMFLACEQEGRPLTRDQKDWLYSSMAKICVRADTEQQFEAIGSAAEEAGLEIHVVTDAGYTEFNGVPTRTCLAIGPNRVSDVDAITRGLALL